MKAIHCKKKDSQMEFKTMDPCLSFLSARRRKRNREVWVGRQRLPYTDPSSSRKLLQIFGYRSPEASPASRSPWSPGAYRYNAGVCRILVLHSLYISISQRRASYSLCATFVFVCVLPMGYLFLNARVAGTCPVTTDLNLRVNVRTTTILE